MDLTMNQRESILRYASALLPYEDRPDSALVTRAAQPMIEWAEQAVDSTDLSARMRALSQQHLNTKNCSGIRPVRFVEQATLHYTILVGGEPSGQATEKG